MVKVRKSMKYLAGGLTCTGDLGMGCVSTSGAILLDYITSIYQPCWRSLGSQEIAKNCKEYIVYEGTANVFTTPNCRVPSCNTDHHPFATIISLCTGTKCWSLVVTIMWDWWFVIPRCVYFPPFNHIVCICFYISYNILYEYHIMSIYLYIIYIRILTNQIGAWSHRPLVYIFHIYQGWALAFATGDSRHRSIKGAQGGVPG